MSLPPSPIIDGLNAGILPRFAFLAGAKLNVFTALGSGATTASEVAVRLGVDPDLLRPLLYGLAATGLIEHRDGIFRNSAEADHYLVRGKPHFIGDVHRIYEDTWRAALLAAESIMAARPLAAHDYANMPPDELAQFFAGLHPSTLLHGWKLADVLDFSETRHLVDVGGGSGAMAIALCGRCPGMRATVVDLPPVVPVAKAYVESSGLGDRIDVQSGDVLQTALEGAYDAAVLRNFLQVFSRADCLPALQNIRQALVPGAQIVVMGHIANDDHMTPETMPLFDLIFLSFYGEGRVYTEGEYREWLNEAGFVDVRRDLTASGLNMLTAGTPS